LQQFQDNNQKAHVIFTGATAANRARDSFNSQNIHLFPFYHMVMEQLPASE